MSQEQNTPGVTPPAENSPFPKSGAVENKSSLMLVGACAVVLVLVLLGWYMMKQSAMQPEIVPMMETTTPGQPAASDAAGSDASVAAFEAQGSSDEVAAIEADLEATDFSSLEETNQI